MTGPRGRMPGVALGCLIALAAVVPTDALAAQQVFSAPGAATFTVPAGVTSLQVTGIGGSGGAGDVGPVSAAAPGGAGATVSATLAVTPGQMLALFVGSNGGDAGSAGGAPDGGSSGVYAGGGGGSSRVSLCPGGGCTGSTAASLIAAGGGGGGAAGSVNAGGSGGAAGLNGANGGTGSYDGGGGGGFAGPSQTGGAAGSPAALDNDGAAGGVGSSGHGGTGGGTDPFVDGEGGGGGGGGLTGGTGGGSGAFSYLGPDFAAGGGGGGGQSLVPAGGTSQTVSGQSPEIAITYQPAPTASITTPSDGALLAPGQVVSASYACQEGAGGPGIQSCSGPVPSGSPIDTSTPGSHSFVVTATSLDGEHTSTTRSYRVAEPPSVSLASPVSGGTYGAGQVVPTSFSCLEGAGGPGISSCKDSNDSSSPGQLDTSTAGPHTYIVSATSSDGLTGTASISYTVDGSAPSIAITSPASGASYTQGQIVKAGYSCIDSDGASDVASCSGPVASGSAIDTSTTGSHTFKVTAADLAGNPASQTVTYTVNQAPPAPGQSRPTVDTSGAPSEQNQGVGVLVTPGITVSCPAGGASCSAATKATTMAPASAASAKPKIKKFVIGTAGITIGPGQKTKITFKLNQQGLRLLRKLGHLRAEVTVVSRVAHDTPLTATKTITIK